MADDLLVTDAVLEDPLVLRRLLSDIIERLPDDVVEVVEEKLVATITQTIEQTSSAAAGNVTLTGDVSGTGSFDDNGNVVVPTLISGGGAERDAICPGYTVTYVSATSLTIAANVTNIFSAGKRVRVQMDTTYYGTVTSVTYSAPDTTINIDLDNAVALDATVADLCLISGSAAQSWAQILDAGSSVDFIDLAIKQLSGVPTWVAVSKGFGAIYVSVDLGVNWTNYGPSGLELASVHYDEALSMFIAVGWTQNVGLGGGFPKWLTSVDGITWIENTHDRTIQYPTGVGSNYYKMNGICGMFHHAPLNNRIYSLVQIDEYDALNIVVTSGVAKLFYSDDSGSTWILTSTTSYGTGTAFDSLVSIYDSELHFVASTGWRYIRNDGVVLNPTSVVPYETLDTDYTGLYGTDAMYRTYANSSNAIVGPYTLSATTLGFDPSYVTAFCSSNLLKPQMVSGGQQGKIAVSVSGGFGLNQVFVSTGFYPAETVNRIKFDEVNSIYVALGSTGSICASVSGLD